MAEAKSRREPNGARPRARTRPDLPGDDTGVAPVNDGEDGLADLEPASSPPVGQTLPVGQTVLSGASALEAPAASPRPRIP